MTDKSQEVHVVLVSDRAARSYPAFLCVNTAAQMGHKAYIYLTSDALSIVKKGNIPEQMAGMPTLDQVLEMALKLGVKVAACGPSIEFLKANGVTKESVKPGIELDTASSFLEKALAATKNGGILTYV